MCLLVGWGRGVGNRFVAWSLGFDGRGYHRGILGIERLGVFGSLCMLDTLSVCPRMHVAIECPVARTEADVEVAGWIEGR